MSGLGFRDRSAAGVVLWNYLCALLLVSLPGALLAERKTDRVMPTLLVKPIVAKVMRGEEIDIPINVVSVYGGDVRIEISSPSSFGTLVPAGCLSPSVPVLRYRNRRDIKVSEDSFRFRVKAPGYAWNTYAAKILIRDPQGILRAAPQNIEFGKIPLGCVGEALFRLSNSYGADVYGTLLPSPPYSIPGGGEFSLAEGEYKTFRICFTPTELKPCIASLKAVPEIYKFPKISLRGEGVVPFLIETNAVTINEHNRQVSLQVTNLTADPITLEWFGSPPLAFSSPIVIPGHGEGCVTVSMGQLELSVGGKKIFHPLLGTRSYSAPVEITAVGPPGRVMIDPLPGSGVIHCMIGQPLSLKGIIHNTSAAAHDAELAFIDHDEEGAVTRKSVVMEPFSKLPFELSWSPKNAGSGTPSVQLIEAGKVIAEACWRVSVESLPAPKASPLSITSPGIPTKDKPSDIPLPQTRIATQGERENVAIWLPPHFKDGILRGKLSLGWRYFGTQNAKFVIAERRRHNAITDRTGELPPDEWVRMRGEAILHDGDWEFKIPMPFRGAHTYIVYPEGEGEKIIAPLTVDVTWKMFAWPPLRLLLVLLFCVYLVRKIRERL